MVETSRDDAATAQLRKAIADLISVKIHDALAHSNGLHRLLAHHLHGVASPQIRDAEQQLDRAIAATISIGRSKSLTQRVRPGAAS